MGCQSGAGLWLSNTPSGVVRPAAVKKILAAALFSATIEATEEAIVDSAIVNATMVGRDGNTALGLPVDEMLAVMKRFGRPA